jgi:hypothetical protein
MVTYQKMLASSTFAIRQSFKRRVEKLRAQLAGEVPDRRRTPGRQALEESYVDAAEVSAALDELDFQSVDPEALEAEILDLEDLIERLGAISDSKVTTMLDAVDAVFEEHPEQKVVLFTQFIETQTYLRTQLEHAGYRVATFNGRMSLDEKEAAIRDFRGPAQVFISTESGGEGRNLQFSHLLVNYDLPWNPMKVEQRIGRLDRIGQKKPVFIYNLACVGTVEERILDVLEKRIRLFTESVGSLDPILGEVEADIEQLIMRHRDRFDDEFTEFADNVERRVREAQENEKILADFALDRASLRRDQANALLGRPPLASHADLERYAGKVLDHFGGTLMDHLDGGRVITLSPKLATKLRTRTGQSRGVFDPMQALELEDLSFFAMGNDLIDAIVDLPLKDQPPTVAARIGRGPRPGTFVELYYEIRGEGPVNYGMVLRHLVDDQGRVAEEELTSIPDVGAGGSLQTVPEWAEEAIEASQAAFAKRLRNARDYVTARLEERHEEERARARRIYDYRRRRLQHRVDELQTWISAKEVGGSDRDRKILPAQHGRLRKNEERLAALESEFAEQLAQIDKQAPEVAGTMWAAGMLEVR